MGCWFQLPQVLVLPLLVSHVLFSVMCNKEKLYRDIDGRRQGDGGVEGQCIDAALKLKLPCYNSMRRALNLSTCPEDWLCFPRSAVPKSTSKEPPSASDPTLDATVACSRDQKRRDALLSTG
ncbi:hypothetical protein J3E69DRAFT_320709 [Trichoderma sp. SZMC 28015]